MQPWREWPTWQSAIKSPIPVLCLRPLFFIGLVLKKNYSVDRDAIPISRRSFLAESSQTFVQLLFFLNDRGN
jgi:hypothetical protein